MAKYWPISTSLGQSGYQLEARAEIALNLIERWGLVAGRLEGEDSEGRAAYDNMPPGLVVERAFALADCFMDAAERRGDVLPYGESDAEAAYRRGGELGRVKSDAEFPRVRIREVAEKMAGGATDKGPGSKSDG